MSQHDQVIDNGPGLTVRTDFNAALAAIFSSSSGPVEPSVKQAGQLWLDTSTPGATLLKVRDIDNTIWIGIATGSGLSLPIAGGTMTGPLILSGDPVAALEAGTKQYIDNLAAGLDVKASVLVATTGNVGLSGLAAIDGVTPAAGSRVLVKDQTAAAQNGIYVAASGAWVRATDMDNWLEVPGASTFVERGTVNADRGFVCTADAGGALGTTPITWAIFGGSGVFQASSAVLSSIAALTTGDGALRLNGGTATLLALATALQFLANAPSTAVLQASTIWAAAAPVTLTDQATIPIDLAAGNNFAVALNVVGATRILGFPTNPKPGQTGWIDVAQDSTGSRALTYAAGYKFAGGAAPALSPAANAVDTLFYLVRSTTEVRLSLTNAWA